MANIVSFKPQCTCHMCWYQIHNIRYRKLNLKARY